MPADKPRLENESDQPTPTPNQAAVQPSGYRSENPSTAGPGNTAVRSSTPENNTGHLNPSAPGDSSTTPGSTTEK